MVNADIYTEHLCVRVSVCACVRVSECLCVGARVDSQLQ